LDINEVSCDRESCKKRDAERFRIFNERKADGAGSMEDWYFEFDLCRNDTTFLLSTILAHLSRKDVTKGWVIEVIKAMGVKVRNQ
jgi:hypothetical protein